MRAILTNIQKQLLLLLVFANIISVSFLHAASGQLDTSFGTSGLTATPVSRSDDLRAMAINSSDSILITGITQTTAPTLFLAQYTSGGILDTTFNSGGSMPGTQTLLIGSRSEANAINLDSGGNILVAGFAIQSQTNILLARYTPTGALDTGGFNNPNGYLTYSIGDGATANAVGVQSTGNIIVAGSSVNQGVPNFTLARFTSSGGIDTTFGTSGISLTQIGIINILQAIAIQPADDKIVAIGTVDNNLTIIRYNADGSIDTGFGTAGIFQPNIDSSVIGYKVALDSSGNIVVVGSANITGSLLQSLVIRCTSSGTFDTGFNGTGYVLQSIAYGSEFYAVTIQSNNYVLAAGYAISPLSNQVCLARYTTTGALDSSYGTAGIALTSLGTDTAARDVKLQSTGYSIVAGITDGTMFLERYTS